MSNETRADTSQETNSAIDSSTLFHTYFELSVEETLRSCLDELGMKMFIEKINEKGFTYYDILRDPYTFQDAIYKIFPNVLEMPAPLFLRVVLENLCYLLKIECDKKGKYDFTKYYQELYDKFIQ